MSEKRYFWLKLMDDFFTSKRIKRLRSMAGGDTYTIIYLKMQLKALKTDGYLYFDGVMDSFPEELALDLDESPDDVRVTINYLLSVGLLETSDNESFKLTFMQNLVGSETTSAQRSREYRANLSDEQKEKERERAKIGMQKIRAERKGVTECYERVTNVEIDIEKDIEINKEKDIELENNPPISPLWDFDKHSNVDNAKHLIENNIYKNTDWFIEHQELWQVVTDWFEYKDSRKPKSSNHYVNEKSISNLLNQIVKACNEYGTDEVINTINRSMASCYSGIVWDWMKNNKKQSINNRVSQVDDW